MKVALAAALVAILTGVGTQAAQNGQIAFSRHRFTNSPSREEIRIANPDGTGLKQLTQARRISSTAGQGGLPTVPDLSSPVARPGTAKRMTDAAQSGRSTPAVEPRAN